MCGEALSPAAYHRHPVTRPALGREGAGRFKPKRCNGQHFTKVAGHRIEPLYGARMAVAWALPSPGQLEQVCHTLWPSGG